MVALEIKDGVADELARGVVSDFAAALDSVEFGSAGGELNEGWIRALTEGVDGGMLEQEELVGEMGILFAIVHLLFLPIPGSEIGRDRPLVEVAGVSGRHRGIGLGKRSDV